MKDKNGNHVTIRKRAETIATYLEEEHWSNDLTNIEAPPNTPIIPDLNMNTALFDMEEMDNAIQLTKTNKQPGPDNIIMELIKWLNPINRHHLLQ